MYGKIIQRNFTRKTNKNDERKFVTIIDKTPYVFWPI